MTKAFFDAIRPMFGVSMSQDQVDGCKVILAATEGLHITFRAYLLATTYHETAHTMQPITERGGRRYFDKYEAGTRIGKVLGNTEPGDGYRYRGRGYVQLTGRRNYALAGRVLKLDLLTKPDLALQPAIAAEILVKGCMQGWFTGKDLADYLPGDYRNARRVVNGTDRAAQIAGYAKRFEAALSTGVLETPRAEPSSFWASIIKAIMRIFK